jgi:hypothetical protein
VCGEDGGGQGAADGGSTWFSASALLVSCEGTAATIMRGMTAKELPTPPTAMIMPISQRLPRAVAISPAASASTPRGRNRSVLIHLLRWVTSLLELKLNTDIGSRPATTTDAPRP